MINDKDTFNPPAFARAGFDGPNGDGRHEAGMSLHDYYAGQALQGFLASSPRGTPDYVASYAWDYADAMLTERRKRGR